jgi:hypothetical protein
MKYIKMLGLAAVAAAALMALVGAGTASATTLTATGCTGTSSGTHGKHCVVGTIITAEAEGKVVLDPPFGAIECSKSHVEAHTTTTGGPSENETVKASLTTLSFNECNATVTVLKGGTLEIHTQIPGTNNGNGTLTSSGAEVTVNFFGTHCIFSTNNTHLGTVTGYTAAKTLEHHATFHISATIPRTGGSSGVFCGSTAAWTGAYTITTPKTLHID